MANRGDFHLINKGFSGKPTRDRFLINHTANAEYLQAILKTVAFNSPIPAINQIIKIEPSWLEVDNSDVYGGFEVTLNLIDKTINITNSDAAAYDYKKGDYFEFSGKIDAFLALDLDKTSQVELIAEPLAGNSSSIEGINDFGYRMITEKEYDDVLAENSKAGALNEAAAEYEKYRDSVDGDGLPHDAIAIWVWNRLNLDVYTPGVNPVPFKYDEMRAFLDSKFPDKEEDESVADIAQESAGVSAEEVSRRVGEFVNNGMRQIIDMK
ncbi:MAG: hypothetical protein QG567_2306 [Campylobacterota bacterium]|nr:hypothetical protein [Campylobacterota bacterium]